jgi:hypothetical protein
MGYNPNIPQSTSKRAVSQRQILTNYQAIFNTFAENHAALGTANQGRHNVLILRPQIGITPDPTTSATQTALYNKAVSTIPNLFFRPNSNQTPIQMTYPSISTASAATSQYSYVAGPFIVYGGRINNVTNGQTIGPLAPGANLRYVGIATERGANDLDIDVNYAIPTNITGTSFTVRFTSTINPPSRNITYLAIGQ